MIISKINMLERSTLEDVSHTSTTFVYRCPQRKPNQMHLVHSTKTPKHRALRRLLPWDHFPECFLVEWPSHTALYMAKKKQHLAMTALSFPFLHLLFICFFLSSPAGELCFLSSHPPCSHSYEPLIRMHNLWPLQHTPETMKCFSFYYHMYISNMSSSDHAEQKPLVVLWQWHLPFSY